jgi:hypothetical protein
MADSGLEPRYVPQATDGDSAFRDKIPILTPLPLVFWETMYRHRNNESEMCIDVVQFRVISATEGRVDFELDIQKEHTVRFSPHHK